MAYYRADRLRPHALRMELLLMLLVPAPIGFFVRSRVVAYLGYVAVHGFVFTFQTLMLLLEWMKGKSTAFGDGTYPRASDPDVLSYGLVNLAIFAAGLGLVALGSYLGSRRRTKPARTAGVSTLPAESRHA